MGYGIRGPIFEYREKRLDRYIDRWIEMNGWMENGIINARKTRGNSK